MVDFTRFKRKRSLKIDRATFCTEWKSALTQDQKEVIPKHYCIECRKKVRRNQDAIICTDCDARFHAKCLKISSWTNKNNTIQTNIDWVCTMCALPSFSDSLFEDNHCQFTTSEIANSEINNGSILAENFKQLRDANRKKCIIASLNVNSLPNKFVEIKVWLRCSIFDILSIQETKIDKTYPNSQFYAEGFKYFRRDRKKGGGGIIAQQKKFACKQLETILGAVYMSRASPANRADLSHENLYFSTTYRFI